MSSSTLRTEADKGVRFDFMARESVSPVEVDGDAVRGAHFVAAGVPATDGLPRSINLRHTQHESTRAECEKQEESE